MSNPSHRRASGAARAEELELRLVSEAIAMVQSGASPRVVVAGIRYGEQLYDGCSRLALDAGVRIVPLRRSDRPSTDIAVEPIHE
jgi:hypothetical protein